MTVDDVDARTAKIAGSVYRIQDWRSSGGRTDGQATGGGCASGAGGGVIVEPVDIPAVGRMAIIQDPTGGVIGIIKYANPDA